MVRVSEFFKATLGKDITELQTGTECSLVAEVAYYLKAIGKTLVCDVRIKEELPSVYTHRMVDMGVKMDVGASVYNESMFYTKSRPSFESLELSKTPTDWSLNVNTNTFKNGFLNHYRGLGYLPLLAYFLVNKWETKTKGVLRLITPGQLASYYLELFVLKYYGNKLADTCISVENTDIGQADWFAYIAVQRQFGYGYEKSSVFDKKKWFDDVAIGDILLLYSIGSSSDRSSRRLQSCHIARVDKITNSGVSLAVFTQVETVLTQVYRVSTSNFDKSYDDYTRFPTMIHNYGYQSLGVGNYFYDEDYLVLKPMIDDGSVQLMVLPTESNGWDIEKVELDTLETIYAVLENRGIKYNKERFLAEYFTPRGVVPFYEKYRKHQPTKYENLSKADLLRKYGDGV